MFEVHLVSRVSESEIQDHLRAQIYAIAQFLNYHNDRRPQMPVATGAAALV